MIKLMQIEWPATYGQDISIEKPLPTHLILIRKNEANEQIIGHVELLGKLAEENDHKHDENNKSIAKWKMKTDEVCYIVSLIIEPKFRSKQWGKKLMAACFLYSYKILLPKGVKKLSGSAEPKLIPFYENFLLHRPWPQK